MRAVVGYIAGAVCIIGGIYLINLGTEEFSRISFGIGIYCIGKGGYVIGDLSLK